jgi:PAS domain S-box-containing protein
MGWPEIVRTLRRHYGGKQESISLLIGVSQATISRWESGRQLPGIPYRAKLLGLFHQIVGQAEIRDPPPELASRLLGGDSIGMMKADSARVLEANDTFLRMTGYTREDLAEGTIPWPPKTAGQYSDADRQTLKELILFGEFAPFERDLIRKDGSPIRVMVAGITVQRDPLQVVCSIIRLSDGVSAQDHTAQRAFGTGMAGMAIPGALFGMNSMSDFMQFLLL